MQRLFSRPFWFAALAAVIFSALLSYTLLWLLKGQLNDAVTLCTAQNTTCSLSEAIGRVSQMFCASEIAGALFVFWLACKIGRSFAKPAPQTVTDSAR